MKYHILTLFPEMFAAITQSGVTRRALDEGRWSLAFTNPRDYTQDLHRTVDDRPYGGGPGMVMLPAPLEAAIAAAKARQAAQGVAASRVVYLSPQGAPLTHARVMRFVEAAGQEGVVLLCGRYEGIDQRFIDAHVDVQLSLGDFVLSGGEIAGVARDVHGGVPVRAFVDDHPLRAGWRMVRGVAKEFAQGVESGQELAAVALAAAREAALGG